MHVRIKIRTVAVVMTIFLSTQLDQALCQDDPVSRVRFVTRPRRFRNTASLNEQTTQSAKVERTLLEVDYKSLLAEDAEWMRNLDDIMGSFSMSLPVPPTQAPVTPPSCQSLPDNTAEAFEEALVRANGDRLVLCSTRIQFQQQLDLSNVPVNVECDGECILDGNNSTRLLSFGSIDFPEYFPVDYNIFFKGFTFRAGVVRDTSNGGDGSTPHGGAMLLVGTATSKARFEECTFEDNFALLENGGAIYAVEGGTLEFFKCAFLRNYAYNGGAISASDVAISVEETSFIENTGVGNFEGAAIYVGSSDLDDPMGMVVCVGDANVFSGNKLLPDIVGPSEGCEGSAELSN